jgi:hypothetical protein
MHKKVFVAKLRKILYVVFSALITLPSLRKAVVVRKARGNTKVKKKIFLCCGAASLLCNFGSGKKFALPNVW